MRTFTASLSLFLLAGCLDWQGSYSAAARKECREIINTDERLACHRRVAENDTARRTERRQADETDDAEALPGDS